MLGIVYCILGNILFGLAFIAVRLGINDAPPLTLLAWRFFISFIVFSLLRLSGIIKFSLKGRNLKPLLVMALFQPIIYFTFETLGIQMTTATESSTVLACMPILTLILAAIVLKEKPTGLQIVGIVVSVLGVTLTSIVKGLSASFNALGYVMLIITVFSDSLYVIFTRKATEFSSAEKTYAIIASGAIVFPTAALIVNGVNGTLGELVRAPFENTNFLLGVLFLSIISSIAGFFMAIRGIDLIGPTRASSFAGLCTVVAVVCGVVFLREDFSLLQGLGILMVLIGVYAANVPAPAAPGSAAPKEDKCEDEADA